MAPPNFPGLKRSYEVPLIIHVEKYGWLILIQPRVAQQLTTPSRKVPESIYSQGLFWAAYILARTTPRWIVGMNSSPRIPNYAIGFRPAWDLTSPGNFILCQYKVVAVSCSKSSAYLSWNPITLIEEVPCLNDVNSMLCTYGIVVFCWFR